MDKAFDFQRIFFVYSSQSFLYIARKKAILTGLEAC